MERMNSGAINVHWSIGAREIDVGLVPAGREKDFIRSLVGLLAEFTHTTDLESFASRELAEAEIAVSYDQLDSLHEELQDAESRLEDDSEQLSEHEETIADLREQIEELENELSALKEEKESV